MSPSTQLDPANNKDNSNPTDRRVFVRYDTANSLSAFFLYTAIGFLILYTIIQWGREGPSGYSGAFWSYDGHRGLDPSKWRKLIPRTMSDPPNFCGGRSQSPVWINLTAALRVVETLHLINYHDPIDIGNVQTTYEQVQIVNMSGERFAMDHVGSKYRLKHIDFRFGMSSAGSEHRVDKERFNLEVQLYHYRDGRSRYMRQPAVLAISSLFKVTTRCSTNFQDFLQSLLTTSKRQLLFHFDVTKLLPQTSQKPIESKSLIGLKSFASYIGSMTVPPCSENVRWYILYEPIEICLKQFSTLVEHWEWLKSMSSNGEPNVIVGDNLRPLQPLNDRHVVKSVN